MDPITAIANGVGEIFSFFGKKSDERLNYQNWLNLSIPEIRWELPKKDNTNLIAVGIISLVFVVTIIAAVFIFKAKK